MKIPIEHSEDRNRGAMPHIRAVVDRLKALQGKTCQSCGRGEATHLIDTLRAVRGVCHRCSDDWRACSNLERMELTSAFVRLGAGVIIERYPVVFNSESVDLGGFIEVIDPAAVDRTIRNPKLDVVALFNHNSDKVLGRRSAHTLTLEKRDRGLLASVDVDAETSFGGDFLNVSHRGDSPGGSFGFKALADDWWMGSDHIARRRVLDMTLREISLAVAFPAYEMTAVVRAFEREARRQPSPSLAFRERQLRQWKAR